MGTLNRHMKAKSFVGPPDVCQICCICEASHICKCLDPPTIFCLNCMPSHRTKHPGIIHQAFPIAALNNNPEEYEVLEKAVAELHRNLERMEQFSHEFDDLLQTCIAYLAEYRSWWLQEVQKEKEELRVAIEAAVQEVSRCLDEGIEPESGLSRALWTLSPEQLQVFDYSITPPDLQSLCQTWGSSRNTLLSLCERNRLSPEDLAVVWKDSIELYGQSTKHPLPVNFGEGGTYIQLDRGTLLCLGGSPPSTAVYELDLISFHLTSLAPLSTERAAAGVAKVAHAVYVFGGHTKLYFGLKSCEKYRGTESRPLGDMKKRRFHFTPCTFRALIYLPCPSNSYIIETFSPKTETFTNLSVICHLSKHTKSVSFIANGELCVLTDGKQLGRWLIGFETEFRLDNTDRGCWSSQPSLVTDSEVFIANGSSGKVEKFSLKSYAFPKDSSF